jgi:hypothetical protein
LDPGLPFAKPQALQALKTELGEGPRVIRAAPARPSFPWGTVLILAAVVALLWMMFRRRRSYVQYPAAGGPGGAPGTYGGPGYGGPAGYGGPGGMGGAGSGIMGGLASGLAVGAGVVAGEELAHHFLDGNGNRRDGEVLPPASDTDNRSANSDMGGSDFGVNEPDSWDDNSGSGGGDWGDSGGGDSGGGGDWS